jgi:hypothetical protein
MAVMHPIDIESYNYTQSEKEFYLALKEQLPDKFHVFYSIRWFETIGGKRVDSECDFLIFDPNFGFITVEVKGGTGIEVEDGQWTLIGAYDDNMPSKRFLKCSPFMQAEKSMRHFHNYFFEEFNYSFNGVYGFAVAFPRYATGNELSNHAPVELIIDLSDMDKLQQKINSIFHYWRNRRNLRAPFSQDQKTRFISAINKRVALSAAAGALIPLKEREFAKLNLVQDNIIDTLYNYKQAFIVGGAGTGKTWIGIKKVLRAALRNKKVLYLCTSNELVQFVKHRLPANLSIDCNTFDGLMLKVVSGENRELERDEVGDILYFDVVSKVNNLEKYDTIVVDEAQDFTVNMALTTRLLMKCQVQSELYVFYDKNQNIFDRDFEDGFAIDYPPFILRYNIRNTGSIYECATENTGLGTDTVANTLLGVKPEYLEFKNAIHTKKHLSGIINRLIQKEYVPNRSIVILSDVPYEQSIMSNEIQIGAYNLVNKSPDLIGTSEVAFRTTSDFKGLEADVVIHLMHTYCGVPMDLNVKQNKYVALTRARYYMYILSTQMA